MKGDFSRDTSALARQQQFTRVLVNQGRVLTDADINEQSHIHLRLLRTLIVDLVGRCWRAGAGAFEVGAGTKNNFTIGPGNFYVDGILCTNEHPCTYDAQPFGAEPDGPSTNLTASFLAFLECHERHVCSAQLSDLREIALGGPDTASRSQVVWRVRAATAAWAKEEVGLVQAALQTRINATNDAAVKGTLQDQRDTLGELLAQFVDALDDVLDCKVAAALLAGLDWARPSLVAWAKRDVADTDPCSIAADSQYRGRENQLYRVEVHRGGLADGKSATFKWSRENGSVVFAIRKQGITQKMSVLTVALESLGRDRRTGLCVGDWVELTSDALEISGTALPLGKVTNVYPTRQSVEVTFTAKLNAVDFSGCTLLRRWDQTEDVDDSGTLMIAESGDPNDAGITLERGVQIRFVPGGLYRTGDFWLIPARVASGDILWRKTAAGDPDAVPCDGIERHRAALGFGVLDAEEWTFTPCGCTRVSLCDMP